MKKLFNLYNLTLFKLIFFNFIFFGKNKLFSFIYKNYKFSYSQIFQDLFVIFLSNEKKNGFFIEIGVGNGVDFSNSLLLEKNYNWRGILCEPDIRNFQNIEKFRNSVLVKSMISEKCSSKNVFFLNNDPYSSSLSRIDGTEKKIYTNSVCLNHLFKKYNLLEVDYISIDTEGNEYEILKNFNFQRYKVNIFTVEHNFNLKKRKKIRNLLKKNGYKNIFKFLSYMDDWYILEKSHF